MSFVVAGVTGHTGKVVAETLLAQNHKVRVIVRNPNKAEAWRAQGAEVVLADLGDVAQLRRAFEGAQGVYALIAIAPNEPNVHAAQSRFAEAMASAAQASQVPHLVFLSSIGAQVPSGTGPIAGIHAAEARLRTVSTTHFTFLRAGYFLENLAPTLPALVHGILPSFLPKDLRIDMVATRDIGKLAAELLLEGTASPKIVELGGPAISMADVASTLSRMVQAPVTVQEAPLEAVVPAFSEFGFSPHAAALYRELYAGFASGAIRFEGVGRRVWGATPLEQVLRSLLQSEPAR